MRLYLTSSLFKRYIPDWTIVLVLSILFFWVLEVAEPFYRQFTINDPKLMYPFATKERVTDTELYYLTWLLPGIIIIVSCLITENNNYNKLHLIQVGLLGLLLSLNITGVITDLLKVWIGNPRPDFLSRCNPKRKAPLDKLVDISICQSKLSPMYLADGMKSTPSGHSSFAFAGLCYLALWLCGHYKLFKLNVHINSVKNSSLLRIVLIFGGPLLLASYIALSRVQDYRHHFFDIVFGGSLGCIITYYTYFNYYPSVFDENCDIPLEGEVTIDRL